MRLDRIWIGVLLSSPSPTKKRVRKGVSHEKIWPSFAAPDICTCITGWRIRTRGRPGFTGCGLERAFPAPDDPAARPSEWPGPRPVRACGNRFDCQLEPTLHGGGIDPNGNPQHIWHYSMVGNPPELGGTTVFNAPIVPVSLDLRDQFGHPRFFNGHRLFYDVTPFVQATVNSPVFQNSPYTSSECPTHFTNAVPRAEFADRMRPNWHTVLNPSVKATRTMVLIKGTYRFAPNADGSCCLFVLVDANTFVNELFPSTFPFDNSTAVGSAENAGDITTKDISTFLFPNTYLYTQNDPVHHCCILGFHTLDLEPGVPSNGNLLRLYVLNYSSCISP